MEFLWLTIVVQWVHIVAGALWVGGATATSLLVFPATTVLAPEQQRRLGRALARRLSVFFQAAAGIVVVFGIVRGTLLGPIRSVDVLFGTTYGYLWLASLVLTIALIVLGARVINPTTERMYGDDTLWTHGPGEAPPAGLMAHVHLLRTVGLIQTAGFAVILVMMVLMRFGA